MVRSIRVVALASWLSIAVGVARADGPKPSPALESALERGHAKYLKGDLDGALAEYTRAIQIEPLFSGSYYGRAKVKREKSDFDGALSDFTRAIELDPRVAEIYVDRGALRLDRGDLAGADADFARALQIDPRCALAHFNRGEVKWSRNDYAGAVADYTRAIESDPRYVRAYVARGDARDEQGDRAGAIADYDRAIGLDPRSAPAYYNRGVAKSRGDDREGAIRDFARAIELDPKFARAYAERGRARVDGGDLAGALSDFDRVLDLGSRSAAAYGNRAGVRWKLGDLDGALADYDRAIELSPNSAVAFSNRGYVRERMGSFAAALSDFARAIVIDPRFLRSYAHRGETRICVREFGAAADDLRKALELDSTYDSARLFLFVAQGLDTDGEAGARAALAANLAVRATPLDRASWTAHLCEFLGGRSSLEALLAAADALPEDQRAHARGSAWFYAGMVAWMRGQQASAVELLERCAAANSTKGAEPAVARAVLTWPRAPATAPFHSADGLPDRMQGALPAPKGEAAAAGGPGTDAGPGHLDAGRGLLIVCGDAELVSDDFSGGRRDVTKGVTRVWGGTAGFPFIGSLVDWMTGGDDVRSIAANGSQTPDPVTVSDPTKRVLERLSNPARISVYWGGIYPRRALPAYRRLRRLLGALAASSGAKLEIIWVKMDKAGEEEASQLGIHQGTFQVSDADESIKCFDGLSISYGTRHVNVGSLIEAGDDGQTLRLSSTVEYDIAAALDRLSRPRKAVVGLVRAPSPAASTAPRGETEDRFSSLAKSVLAKVYGDDFRDVVDLRSSVPGDVTVLVVAAPREWSAPQTYHLEQFLLRGGRVLLLLDPIDVRAAWGDKPTAKSGIDEWLDAVGVKVAPGVVGDLDEAHMGSAMTAEGKLTAYSFFVQALRAELSQEHPATRGFASVPFYFPAELVVDAKTQVAAGRTATVLATTSASSFVRKETTGLGDPIRARADAAERAKRVLLVQLDGPFTSFWKGKPLPDDAGPVSPVAPADGPAESAAAKAFLTGWAAREGVESDAVTGYPKRIRRTKDGGMMVLIPAGMFPMGAVPGDELADASEKPRHAVTLTHAYYLDEHEVTVGMWKKYVANGGGKMPSGDFALAPEATDAHPIHFVSWDEARDYATWARAALPTEAQWERAARGGHDDFVYPWGPALDATKTNGPWSGRHLAPAKSFAPNDFGLYGMSGNVDEWCADWFDESYYAKSPAEDPAGPQSGSKRVSRGGSYFDDEGALRVSTRIACAPRLRSLQSGFRCARSLPDRAPAAVASTPASASALDVVVGLWGGTIGSKIDGGTLDSFVIGIDKADDGVGYDALSRADATMTTAGHGSKVVVITRYKGRAKGDGVSFESTERTRTINDGEPAILAQAFMRVVPKDGHVEARVGNDAEGYTDFTLVARAKEGETSAPSADAVRGSWGGVMTKARLSDTLSLTEMYVDVSADEPWQAKIRMNFTVHLATGDVPVVVKADYVNGKADGTAMHWEKVPWHRTVPATGQKTELDGNALLLKVTPEGGLDGQFEGADGFPFALVRRPPAGVADPYVGRWVEYWPDIQDRAIHTIIRRGDAYLIEGSSPLTKRYGISGVSMEAGCLKFLERTETFTVNYELRVRDTQTLSVRAKGTKGWRDDIVWKRAP